MKKRSIKKQPSSEFCLVQFCDLSNDLDRNLSWVAGLLSSARDDLADFETSSSETGHFLFEYLGKRAVLEHVFFGRSLRNVRWENSRVKAEVWRVSKIRAKSRLKT